MNTLSLLFADAKYVFTGGTDIAQSQEAIFNYIKSINSTIKYYWKKTKQMVKILINILIINKGIYTHGLGTLGLMPSIIQLLFVVDYQHLPVDIYFWGWLS